MGDTKICTYLLEFWNKDFIVFKLLHFSCVFTLNVFCIIEINVLSSLLQMQGADSLYIQSLICTQKNIYCENYLGLIFIIT